MNKKNLLGIGLVLFVIYVSVGDRILPPTAGSYSITIRSHLLGMLPSIRPQNRDAKTEKAIENLGQ